VGPFEAWRAVVTSMGEVTRAFGEFERTMNWQPQAPMPERRGPGRPRKESRPAAGPEERIVSSVAELMVPDDEPEPEPEPAPSKRPRTRRRAVANGEAA
jgi:hypothetical protein